MKKTTYTVNVYYQSDGSVESFEGLTAEIAEAINAQAHAHQDLHWFIDNEGTMYEFLIPWEAVLAVTIVKEVTDETAPTDSICGD